MLIKVIKPYGIRFKWNGGYYKVPTMLVLDEDEFASFQIIAKTYNLEFEQLDKENKPKFENKEQEIKQDAETENQEPVTKEDQGKDIKEIEKELQHLKKSELEEKAKELGIENPEQYKKAELIDLIAKKLAK